MPEVMKILVRADDHKRQIALLDEGKLAEFYVEEEAEGSLVNAILLGRVDRVVPGMSAAFVQIGQPLNGFLPLTEKESFAGQEGEHTFKAGEELLVQVRKDAHD